ncbi:MAG: sel1 repeat family protein [Alphaproteobacteria bacterium]|nr:sel1 repeat family protein [Alphaproteobacteria bacterium]
MGQIDYSYVTECIERAELGTTEALYDLGLLYSIGQGVDQNFIEAHKWFNLAAINGMKGAQVDRAEIAVDMSNRDISTAQRMAREWLATH